MMFERQFLSSYSHWEWVPIEVRSLKQIDQNMWQSDRSVFYIYASLRQSLEKRILCFGSSCAISAVILTSQWSLPSWMRGCFEWGIGVGPTTSRLLQQSCLDITYTICPVGVGLENALKVLDEVSQKQAVPLVLGGNYSRAPQVLYRRLLEGQKGVFWQTYEWFWHSFRCEPGPKYLFVRSGQVFQHCWEIFKDDPGPIFWGGDYDSVRSKVSELGLIAKRVWIDSCQRTCWVSPRTHDQIEG